MKTVSQVTRGNKNPSNFNIKCTRTGQLIAGAGSHFDIVCVTMKPELALPFDHGAATKGCTLLAALYPSTEWQPVAAI